MSKERIIILVIALFSLSFFTNCATIIHTRKQMVSFTSNPEGAKIIVDDNEMGVTPKKIELERKQSHSVKLERENHKPSMSIIRNKLSWWYFGNVLFGPFSPVGFLVDLFNGAMYKFEKDSISADLVYLGGQTETEGETVQVKEVRNIAIMDLKSMGIGEHVASLLTEKLRSEYFATGVYNVMNREDMTKLMDERSFQRSEECDTPECFAEIGKMLGVQKMIAGSIGKLGSTYSLTLKQIDIESSKNEKIINLSEKCEEDYLFKMIEGAAKQLMKSAAR